MATDDERGWNLTPKDVTTLSEVIEAMRAEVARLRAEPVKDGDLPYYTGYVDGEILATEEWLAHLEALEGHPAHNIGTCACLSCAVARANLSQPDLRPWARHTAECELNTTAPWAEAVVKNGGCVGVRALEDSERKAIEAAQVCTCGLSEALEGRSAPEGYQSCAVCPLIWKGPYTDCPGCQAQAAMKAVSDLQGQLALLSPDVLQETQEDEVTHALKALGRGIRMLGVMPSEHPQSVTYNDALKMAAAYVECFIGREDNLRPTPQEPAKDEEPT